MPKRLFAFVAALFLCGGCMNDDPMTVDWDLSSSHTLDDVDWPADQRDSTATAFEDLSGATIELPGGERFEAGEEVEAILLERDGPNVTLAQINFEKQSLEGARDRARALAEEWDLPIEPLDPWYEEQIEEHGGTDVTEPVQLIGPKGDGVQISADIRYSFNEAEPARVSLTVFWLDTLEQPLGG